MFRMFRPGIGLITTFLLGFSSAVQAADYLLDAQARIGSATRPNDEISLSEFDAVDASIAVAPEHYRALVAWSADDAGISAGEDSTLNLANDEQEIVATVVSTLTLAGNGLKTRVSRMGNDDETSPSARAEFDAWNPVAVWNPVAEEFLVVWSGDDDTAPLVNDEFEIFAQRISLTGARVGSRVRVSTMGNDSTTAAGDRERFDALEPAVAVDPDSGNYLVVWQGDHDKAPLVDEETEIFGRILDSTAKPAGGQFRISVTGDDTETDAAARAARDAVEPDVGFNPVSGNFVVAWQSDDDRAGLASGENEIFARQVDVSGNVLGADAVRVSSQGPSGVAAFDALKPAITVAPSTGAMLVAWQGDTDTDGYVDNEFEIYAQLLDSGMNPLASAVRYSNMGDNDETDPAVRTRYAAVNATLKWSATQDRFFIAWQGDTSSGGFVDDEYEIFGRFLHADGSPASSQFNVSVMGNNGETDAEERRKFDAFEPVLAESGGAFIALWSGDSYEPGSGDGRMQIFGRRVAESATSVALVLRERYIPPTAPEPALIKLRVANFGDETAEDVRVHPSLSTELPFEWQGCDAVSATNDCELGDLAPDETVDITFLIRTDDIGLGDEQSTYADFILITKTAVENAQSASVGIFAGITVEVEGGNGALGLPWLAFLGALGWLGYRRRQVT